MSAREFRLRTGWSIKEIAQLFELDAKVLEANEDLIFLPDLSILSEILNMPELEYDI